jgi:hypothetical protein
LRDEKAPSFFIAFLSLRLLYVDLPEFLNYCPSQITLFTMAARRDTRLFFLKTFDTVGGSHDDAPALVRKMIGVRGANIRVITSKVRGTRINLSAHDYKDTEGNVVPAMYKVCATIRSKDEATARRVVAELTTLKGKCENPAQLTWTPTNLAPGAFIGKGAIIIRSFNKRHNVRCWFDNEARHFVIESIERRNVLAAVADLERRDVLPPSPTPASVGARSTNSFATLADVHNDTHHTINLDSIDAMVGVSDELKVAMKSALDRSVFPTVGTAADAGIAARGKWSARREDTMAVITAVPVTPPAAPKKPARPVGLTIKCTHVPVMQSLDSPLSGADEPLVRQVADGGEATLAPPPPIGRSFARSDFSLVRDEWWDESEEEEEDDGFGAQIRRQTSFRGGAAGADGGIALPEEEMDEDMCDE